MTNDEAKFILSAYRPNGRDADDPVMAEALERAARDPELAEWFRREREVDQAISDRLNQVAPPPSLKSNILAGHRMMAPVKRSGFWRRQWLAWAAGVLVLAALSYFVVFSPSPSSATALAQFRLDMTDFLGTRLDRLDYAAGTLPEVKAWLEGNELPAEIRLPKGLKGQRTLGCRVIDWRGAKVTLICFVTGNGKQTHLMVVDESAFDGVTFPPEASHEFSGEWTTASWNDNGRVYLLAGKGDRPQLRQLL